MASTRSMKICPYALCYFVILFVTLSQTQESEYIYRSYQGSITCTSQYPPREPRSLSDIQDIVRYAAAVNVKVKAIGSQHSISDSICTTGIPIRLNHITHFYYHPERQTVTVGAGLEVKELYEMLHQHGRGFSGHPTFAGATIGGAIANGVIGTGLKYPSTLSQQIVSVIVVDGRGIVRKVTADEEDFKAFRVNLGLVGIVYEIELLTQPQYKLSIRHYPVNDETIHRGDDIIEMAKNNDVFQFWWFPTNKQIIMGVSSRVPVHVPGNCKTRYISDVSWLASNGLSTVVEAFQVARDDVGFFHVQTYAKLCLYKSVPGREPIFVEDDGETSCLHNTSIGYSHRMLSNKCNECPWSAEGQPLLDEDSSILIPLSKLMPALRTMSQIFAKQLTQFPLTGIFVRFLTAGDGYMALNGGQSQWASIEWLTIPRWDKTKPRLGISGYQAIAQALLEDYDGRPHWAKNGLYFTNPQIIQKSYPHLDKFIAVMNKYDPNELFMNTFGERIKHGRNRVTVSSEMAEHCALNDVCICKSNFDCGNEGPLDYTCGNFVGFPKYNVCLPGVLEQAKGAYSRSVINLMALIDHNEDSTVNYLRQYDVLNNVLVYKEKKSLSHDNSNHEYANNVPLSAK